MPRQSGSQKNGTALAGYQDETFEFYNAMTDPWLTDNIARRNPTDPLFLQLRDQLYETCREWGLDLVTDSAILRPGTPWTSFLGWEPPAKGVTNNMLILGDVEHMARTPNYQRMYQIASSWRPADKRTVRMPGGADFIEMRQDSSGMTVHGSSDDNWVVLRGGTNRTVYLGDGDDVLSGDPDARTQVSEGRIIAYGGRGNDYMYGSGGHDHLYGGEGNDSLIGGAGNDYLDGGAGDDYLSAGDGNNTLIGGAGSDTLLGGAGNDLFIITGGSHSMTGGSGADTFRIMRTGQLQTITDLNAEDTLDLSDWAAIQPVRLAQVGAHTEITAGMERLMCLGRTVAAVRPRITGATTNV